MTNPLSQSSICIFENKIPALEIASIFTAFLQFLNDNSLDDKNLVSGNEKTVNRALTLMAVQQKMRTVNEMIQMEDN